MMCTSSASCTKQMPTPFLGKVAVKEWLWFYCRIHPSPSWDCCLCESLMGLPWQEFTVQARQDFVFLFFSCCQQSQWWLKWYHHRKSHPNGKSSFVGIILSWHVLTHDWVLSVGMGLLRSSFMRHNGPGILSQWFLCNSKISTIYCRYSSLQDLSFVCTGWKYELRCAHFVPVWSWWWLRPVFLSVVWILMVFRLWQASSSS